MGLPAVGGQALMDELIQEAEQEEEQLAQPLRLDPLVVEALGSTAQMVRQKYEIGLSDTTSEAAPDIADQCEALEEAGLSDGAVIVSAGIENWLRRTYREYKLSESALNFPAWAAD